jgi:hypothetical protein
MPQYVAGTFRSVPPAVLAYCGVTGPRRTSKHCANG